MQNSPGKKSNTYFGDLFMPTRFKTQQTFLNQALKLPNDIKQQQKISSGTLSRRNFPPPLLFLFLFSFFSCDTQMPRKNWKTNKNSACSLSCIMPKLLGHYPSHKVSSHHCWSLCILGGSFSWIIMISILMRITLLQKSFIIFIEIGTF